MTAVGGTAKERTTLIFEIGQLLLARARQIWHLGRTIFRRYRRRIHRIVGVLTERDLTGALVVDLTVD
jgi:hypothetical protein